MTLGKWMQWVSDPDLANGTIVAMGAKVIWDTAFAVAVAESVANECWVETVAIALLHQHERNQGIRRWEWADLQDFSRAYWMDQARRLLRDD